MQATPALKPLLMNAEPLAEILRDNPERWAVLAAELAAAYPQGAKEDKVYTLGTVYYAFKKDRLIVPYQKGVNEGLVTKVVNFLEVFMTANG
ncbi:hypothetical protein [Kutzneria chonburiensis]|uniref:Uncharacterized protein n=1 Tax=Kutzneria chonburiensis TaxID=1483604 RepID=A0ABV6N0X2_9PSEU|nr:hypothetical protein [Kutzneria chonburiensis]